MEENLESIEGYVDHIIYRNADNGYTVLVLVCNEEEETCVGVFSDIAEGENIKAKGSYTYPHNCNDRGISIMPVP